MREPGGPTQPQQTMEEIHRVLADGLGPEIPNTLLDRYGEQVIRTQMPEGATYIRREADGSLGRPSHLVNGVAIDLDSKTQAMEVTQNELGGHIAYSYNQSGTTDILTVAATPEAVRTRVQERGDIQESTAQILGMTEINGRPVDEVERGLRGVWGGYPHSNTRLGRNESLVTTLAEDNELVRSAGFTHAQLAEPLAFMMAQFASGSRAPGQVVEYNGRTYQVEGDVARGFDDSAISGEQRTIMMVRVVAVDTGATLQFDSLSPVEVGEHGFYGGTGDGVTRRVSPGAIAAVFNLSPATQ